MIRLFCLSWITGITLVGSTYIFLDYFYSPYWVYVAILFLPILLLIWWKDQKQQYKLWYFLSLIIICLGIFSQAIQFSDRQLIHRLAQEIQQRQTIDGIVYINQLSDGKIENWRQKAQLLIPSEHKTLNILLYPKRLYSQDGEQIGLSTEAFQLGQFYQVTVDIKPPHSYVNLGGFDQEKWLLQENIQGTATVLFSKPVSEQQIIQMGWYQFFTDQQRILPSWKLWVEQLRQEYRNHLLQSDQQSYALLLGLLTGDRSGINKETIHLYQMMGISHLLAISGPHVLILATMLTWLFMQILHYVMKTKSYGKMLYLRFSKQRLYLPLFVLIVSFYVAFTGFEIPALRTWLICIICSVCLWMRWKISMFSLLLIAASIILYVDCFAILSAAFWLSFGASAILLMIYQQIQQQYTEGYESIYRRIQRIVLLLWQSQWRIFIALMPIVLWQFKAVSLISPFINLFAIPFLSLIIVPLDICAAVLWQIIPILGQILWGICAVLLSLFNGFLSIFSGLAQKTYIPSVLTSIQLFCFSLVILILSLPKGFIHRIWAILFLFPVFFSEKPAILQLDILDVGQGQALVLRTQNHQMLIDAGGGAWQEGQLSLGDRVVVPFLRSQGIRSLDEILLTHLDLDHRGGANAVVEHIKVRQLRANKYETDKLPNKDIPFFRCEQGQQWVWDQVTIHILWPLADNPRHNANESSCVVLIEAPMGTQKLKILLMGDTGWESEYYLLQHYPDLRADILVLGHHGSKYSSAYDFLKQINPNLAISSAGIDNRYGHPTPETLARLADLQIPHLNTINTGRIHINLPQRHHFWYLTYDRQRYKWLNP